MRVQRLFQMGEGHADLWELSHLEVDRMEERLLVASPMHHVLVNPRACFSVYFLSPSLAAL